MPRLLGVEIPAKKKVAYSLRYINGIGPARADQLVKEAALSPDMRAQDLTEEQLNKILHLITEPDHLLMILAAVGLSLSGWRAETTPRNLVLAGLAVRRTDTPPDEMNASAWIR